MRCSAVVYRALPMLNRYDKHRMYVIYVCMSPLLYIYLYAYSCHFKIVFVIDDTVHSLQHVRCYFTYTEG